MAEVVFHSWVKPNGNIKEAVQPSAMRAPDALSLPSRGRRMNGSSMARGRPRYAASAASQWVRGGFMPGDDWVPEPIKKIPDYVFFCE